MIYIKKNIKDKIINTIGKNKIESGGIIGIKENCIVSFFFDKKICKEGQYTPSVRRLNKIIKKWSKDNVMFVGFVHSHPNGYNRPSSDDFVYAEKILENNKFIDYLLFPIVTIVDSKINIDYYLFKNKFVKVLVEEIL